jgi:hypothetical protein
MCPAAGNPAVTLMLPLRACAPIPDESIKGGKLSLTKTLRITNNFGKKTEKFKIFQKDERIQKKFRKTEKLKKIKKDGKV